MKKQLLLSVLFLVCFQVVMIGQDILQSSKHEVSISTGVSMPFGDFAYQEDPTDATGLRINWLNLPSTARVGANFSLCYTYNKSEWLGFSMDLGYQFFTQDNSAILEFSNRNITNVNEQLRIESKHWNAFTIMPGIMITKRYSNISLKGNLNVGQVMLISGGVTKAYYNNVPDPFRVYDYSKDFTAWGFKTGLNLHYRLQKDTSLFLKNEYFFSRISRPFDITPNISRLSFIETFNISAFNLSVGLTYNL